MHKLAASADHVLCVFPFEPALLAKAGVAASYVGHPLADAIPLGVPRASARAALAEAVLHWLDDPAACDALARRFTALHLDLRRDTARAATDAIAQVLEA